MTSRDEPRNDIFRRLRAETVTKPDGRYLIYYSSERDGGEPAADAPAARSQTPRQQPWSPETGPVEGTIEDDDV